ncbi:unnamed protein product [Strongylus vulgaris]|uniref:Uncharacterized protein n=1 Tax=Strongylus vulgaris TaxID=40348 RepID=A0A3P7L1Q0_STRVU|nr:unnamed protein product [Strongylus vulgaris]
MKMNSMVTSLCRNAFRHLLLTLGFFCLTSVNSNYIIINFTFICMARPLYSDNTSPASNDVSLFIYIHLFIQFSKNSYKFSFC